MRLIARLFVDHPTSVGENYLEHCGVALGFAARMFLASCACLVHAFVPGLFERTGSRQIDLLHDRMLVNRARKLRDTAAVPPSKLRV